MDTGILLSKGSVKLHNITLFLKIDNIDFTLTKRATKIIAIECYFKIDGFNTSVHLDTAKFTICTRCSILSSYNIVGNYTLTDKLLHANFTSTKTYLLPKIPKSGELIGCL